MTHNPHPPLDNGTVLNERYKIEAHVSGGGLNRAYEALDLFEHDITTPVYAREMRYNPAMNIPQRREALATFRRAVDFLHTLKHPAIPKVVDAFDQGGRAYLITTMPVGAPLQTRIEAPERIPVAQLVRWAIALCDALDFLHSLEPDPFVVSNVTPASVHVADDGRVTLMEFGISKVFVHTMLDTNIGPVGYSPPELYLGDISPATDVYGVGATLHHALTKTDPRIYAPFSFDERPIRDFNTDVPEALADIVMKATHPLTRERYPNCDALKAALLAWGGA